MAKTKAPGAGRNILYILIILAAIAGYGFALGIYGITLVSPWIPVAAGIAGAAITGAVFWNKWSALTRSHSFALNFGIHFVATAGIWVALLLGLNYLGASPASRHKEMAVVEKKYSETHHRSKRVGRRYVTQGEPYKVYYAEIEFSDGRQKKLGVGASRYMSLHPGDSIPIIAEKGLFGFPIVHYGKERPSVKKGKRSSSRHSGKIL